LVCRNRFGLCRQLPSQSPDDVLLVQRCGREAKDEPKQLQYVPGKSRGGGGLI